MAGRQLAVLEEPPLLPLPLRRVGPDAEDRVLRDEPAPLAPAPGAALCAPGGAGVGRRPSPGTPGRASGEGGMRCARVPENRTQQNKRSTR